MSSKIRTLYALTFALLFVGVFAEKGSSLPPGARLSQDGGASALSIAAGGDDCASATVIASVPYNDNMGNTSTATDSPLFLGAACTGGGAGSREGPDRIYSFTVAAGNSLTFQVTPAATYDVDIYLLGTCGSGSTCVIERDTGIEGQPETLGPVALSPGTYYLYVDSVYPLDDKLGSGTYTLSVTGTLGIPNNAKFYTLPPCRVLDTRDPAGPYGGPALAGGAVRTFTIAGRCSVPPTAKSVSINATVVQPTSSGYLTLYPGGTATPLASTINFGAGQIRANNAIVPLGAGGTLSVLAGQGGGNTVHFLLDVNGYFQ
jgi:hypothetical protein